MFLRIVPEKVPIFWNLVKPGLLISQSIMATSSWHSSNIVLEKCLCNEMQLWLAFGESLEDYVGFVVTYLWHNPFDKSTSLFIYLVYSYVEVPEIIFAQGLDAIAAYAKRRGCVTITFVSPRKGLGEMVTKVFGNEVRSETFYIVAVKEA